MEGLEVVMIGHSEIVGKPAAMILMAEGATVTVCHHMTRSVTMHSRRADVVVVAVGKAHLISADMIKPGAVVIDIGINQIKTDDGFKIVGDVDTDVVTEVAGWITAVPVWCWACHGCCSDAECYRGASTTGVIAESW